MTQLLHQISENVFLVQGKNQGHFPYSNSVLILTTSQEAVLIDTGCGIEILQKLTTQYNITTIINSHTHPDHSAGNWFFQDQVKSIIVPKEGFSTSGNIIALSERFTEPGYLSEYWQSLVSGDYMNFKNCPPTTSYDKSTKFQFDDLSLRPIHTPGHTIDHYCLYEPNQKILFVFDYDLTAFGPWYGHRESNLSDVRNSLRKLSNLSIHMLVSSHRGLLTDNIEARFKRYFQKIDERGERIKQLIRNGDNSLRKLVERAPIYREYPYAEPLLRYWEEQMIRKHLDEFQAAGELPEMIS